MEEFVEDSECCFLLSRAQVVFDLYARPIVDGVCAMSVRFEEGEELKIGGVIFVLHTLMDEIAKDLSGWHMPLGES